MRSGMSLRCTKTWLVRHAKKPTEKNETDLLTIGSLLVLAPFLLQHENLYGPRPSLMRRTALCEGISPSTITSSDRSSSSVHRPSWMRRTIASWGLAPLPLPRLPLAHDPALTLDPKLRKQRERDERRLKRLQQQLQQAVRHGDKHAMGRLLKQSFEILYGSNLQPQDRQVFLERYGCTGYTDDVVDYLLELGKGRGFVELGAGHGQWARVLTDRHQQQCQDRRTKKFDFVLAYDNMSELPLDPKIYTNRTRPHQEYFYDQVQSCGNNMDSILQQWQCRGRVLLLIFPPPGPMAAATLHAYACINPLNDTIAYVGEGRGGANADRDFFNMLESGDWTLVKELPVKTFGSKAYECLVVLKRSSSR